MKKLLIAAAASTVLGCSLAPISAMAQSSVTLYGLIDEGLNYTSNTGGHSNIQMESGFAQGSRWGLKGSEDLGGGNKAIFQLENGFDVNSGKLGQGGRMFGRQAYVGLSQSGLAMAPLRSAPSHSRGVLTCAIVCSAPSAHPTR